MKYIFLVPDGMADEPIEELNNRTPLEAAKTPYMDYIAKNGRVGLVKTIPRGLAPASDVANLSLLGYAPEKYYTGRAALEAAYMKVALTPDDVAFRCNLITASDIVQDYSAGHISDKEARELIAALSKKLGSEQVRFYPGKSYRNLAVIKSSAFKQKGKINCFPPHDIMGKSVKAHLPKGKGAQVLISLMQASKEVLANHEINRVRIDLKENPANMIWLWGEGSRPKMPSFKSLYGLSGAVISAVDLIKGIASIAQLKVIEVEGATGYYDTNFKGKAQAALDALFDFDFVFLHLEATDEAGHNGHLREKISMIERFDKLIVGPLLEYAKQNNNSRIVVCPDHPTPIALRTHTSNPVPFAIFGEGIEASGQTAFSEKSAKGSGVMLEEGPRLMEDFLRP